MAFKNEIKISLDNRSATKLEQFDNEKYKRTEEHRDAQSEIKKIWLDCGHRVFDDEFDTMNKQLNPNRFDKTPKTTVSSITSVW